MRSLLLFSRSGTWKVAITVIVAVPTHLRQEENVLVIKESVAALLLEYSLTLLLFPLIEPPAKLAVPPFGGLEIAHFAQPLGLCAYVLLVQEDLAINFGVESELHLSISGPSSSFFAFTPVFLPSQQVSSRDAVFLWDLLRIHAFQYLNAKWITCLTACYFSETVYFR